MITQCGEWGQKVEGDDESALRCPQHVIDFDGHGKRAERDDQAAGHPDSICGDQILGKIRQQQANTVAGLDPDRLEQ